MTTKETTYMQYFIIHVHIRGAPPTWASPLHCVQSCFQLTTMSAANMYGFFSNCFQSVPMNSKKYMECLSILLFIWGTHPSMIPWHLMSVYVDVRHRILRGAGIVFCMSATSAMLYKQCRRAQWLMWFFFPWHPSAECIHIFPNTHKDTHIYNNIATFSNVNMHVSSSIAFNSKYCAVNYQTYLRPTKKIYIF